MVTAGDGVPQNPTDVTLSGATAVGYSGTGYKTYWLAYGIQMQWGLASTVAGRDPAPFPIAFPNAVFSVVAVSNYTSCAISKPTLTGFNTTLGSDTGDGLLWWIAVGR